MRRDNDLLRAAVEAVDADDLNEYVRQVEQRSRDAWLVKKILEPWRNRERLDAWRARRAREVRHV